MEKDHAFCSNICRRRRLPAGPNSPTVREAQKIPGKAENNAAPLFVRLKSRASFQDLSAAEESGQQPEPSCAATAAAALGAREELQGRAIGERVVPPKSHEGAAAARGRKTMDEDMRAALPIAVAGQKTSGCFSGLAKAFVGRLAPPCVDQVAKLVHVLATELYKM